jgi:hypothetical protein
MKLLRNFSVAALLGLAAVLVSDRTAHAASDYCVMWCDQECGTFCALQSLQCTASGGFFNGYNCSCWGECG